MPLSEPAYGQGRERDALGMRIVSFRCRHTGCGRGASLLTTK